MKEHLEELKLGGRPMTKLEKANKEIEKKDYLLKEQGKELKELYKEIEKLHSIIKEVREYIEEHSEMTDLQINGIENILAFRGSCKKLLEILDKVEEK